MADAAEALGLAHRLMNEVPSIFLVVIVILAIVKPF